MKKRALAVFLALCISSVNVVGAFAASTSEGATDQPAVEAEVEYADEDKPDDPAEGTEQNLTENETADTGLTEEEQETEDTVEETVKEEEPTGEEETVSDGETADAATAVDEEEPVTTEEGSTEEQEESAEEEQQITDSEQPREEAVEPSSESDTAASSELDEEEPAAESGENSEDYAEAAPAAEDNPENERLLSGECGAEGDNLTWELTGEDKLTLYINGSGEMADYTEDSRAPWAESAGNIATISIGPDVTSIGSYAFAGCQSVEELNISQSIAFIGENAFLECSSLNTIYYDGTQEAWEKLNHSVLPEGTSVICALVVDKAQVVKEKKQAAAKQKTYQIKYVLNGGKAPKGNPSSYNADTATIKLKSPTKDNYTFGGWYKDAAFNTKITSIPKGSTGNLKLYAKWTTKEYKIIYKLKGGKNNKCNPATYTKESSKIKLAKPKKKGYKFAGWFSDKKYKNKITAIEEGSTGDKTVYAKWTKRKYTIKYVLNKGKAPKGNPKSYYVTSKTIKLKKPTRKYYVFKGWYKDAKFKTKVTSIKKGSTGNLKLYAKWVPKKYTITYQMNGGTNNKNNPATYTKSSSTIKLANPTRTGYKFAGWYSDREFRNKITTIKKGTTGNRTIYAKWTANQYSITFNANTDSISCGYTGTMSTVTCTYGKKYTLPANKYIANDKRYIFVGWNTKADGSGTTYKGASCMIQI